MTITVNPQIWIICHRHSGTPPHGGGKSGFMSLAEKIILASAKKLPKDGLGFNTLKRQLAQKEKGKTSLPNKTVLLTAYHKLVRTKSISPNKPLEKMLTRRAVRTLSGVTIITSLIKPYPCPGQCVYCPLDERMPKSYLSDEPAAARALSLKFDPYNQVAKRIEALENNGHPTDKIELIIKGGTWNSYPLGYQYWFVLESFRAANETSRKNSPLGRGGELTASRGGLETANPPLPRPSGELTEQSPLLKLKKELARQQRLNERAKHRIIGLTLETRPDCINYRTVWQMREMGCTRIELGIQNTNDNILKLIKRGHDNARAKSATALLKNYGYKTDFHLMPQLPGATPESDLAMMTKVFEDPGFRPDMIKVYPCSVIKNSELYEWFKAGKYRAYSVESLIAMLKKFKTRVPRYCRISRLIRDIPGQYIEDGNKTTNLRQVIQAEMKKEGLFCKCLRCREIGHVDIAAIKDLTPHLFIDEYQTNGGLEYFLSFCAKGASASPRPELGTKAGGEDSDDRGVVFAFCRLRLVDKPIIHPNKKFNSYAAYIRELHTYGQLVCIGKQEKESSQHKGLGKKLIKEAEKICNKHKIKKLAVISGVGVRDYYRQLGYRLENTYMVKNLKIKRLKD